MNKYQGEIKKAKTKLSINCIDIREVQEDGLYLRKLANFLEVEH